MPGLVLGQIIGRFGNFMNREAFGEYTDSLFAMRLKVSDVTSANITSTMREHISIQDGIRYIQVHPTFLYEAAWNVLVLTAMLLYTKKKKFDGEIFLIYLIGYGLGRAWIEGLRTDQLQIGTTGIAVSQVFSAGLVVAGGRGCLDLSDETVEKERKITKQEKGSVYLRYKVDKRGLFLRTNRKKIGIRLANSH